MMMTRRRRTAAEVKARGILIIGMLVCLNSIPMVWAREATGQILLQTSPVAGFQFHEGKRIWEELREGDALTLIREPGNPYDPKAVRVEWRGHKIGYVPRADNAAVARFMDGGESVTARVIHLQASHDPWKRVLFEVYVPLQ
jgi:HIRAN domain